MPYPHNIRLRGPWSFDVAEQIAGAAVPHAGRTTVPCEWGEMLGSDFRGRVRYRRSFNPPATLDPHERLWLVCEGVDAFGRISLNGSLLGTIEGYALPAGFDVTGLIAARNEIGLEVELPPKATEQGAVLRPGRESLPGGPVGEVRLEVRSPWHIESLAVWNDPDGERLMVSGRIAGEPASEPLAVVVSGCEREIAYCESRVGEIFHADGTAEGFSIWSPESAVVLPVEIKLLSGGTSVWQTVLTTALRTAAELPATVVEPILPDTAYDVLDRTGQAIVQRVPREWAEQVCPRLAHHPSITAWSALPGQPMAGTTSYGKRWV